ncbi:MAG: STT3 domain-containing protein [Nitrososphaeria archaeon]
MKVIRPRLSFGTAVVVLAFALLTVLNIYVRLMPERYGFYLNEFDPYYHYYVTNLVYQDLTKYGLEGINKYMHTIDYNFWYPWGRNIPATSPSGLYFLVAVLYIVLKWLGMKIYLYDFVAIVPIFTGVLISIPAYFISLKMTGNKYVGLLGVLLLSSAPGLILRTDFGWYKGSPFAFLFMPLSLLFLVYAFESGKAQDAISVKPGIYALIAGLLVGYAQTMWGGTENMNGVVGLAFLFAPLYLRPGKMGYYITKQIILNEVLYTVGALVAVIYPRTGRSWIYSPTMLLLYLAIAVSALYYANERLKIVSRNAFFGVLIAIVLAGLGAVAYLIPHLINLRYLSALNPLLRTKPSIVSTVAEQLPISGVETLFTYGLSSLLVIIAGYFLLKRRTLASVILSIFLFWSFYAGTSFGQLMDFMGLAVVIGAPLGLYYAVSEIRFEHPAVKKIKRAQPQASEFKYEKIAAAAVLIGLTAFPVYTWIPQNNFPVSIVNSATRINQPVPAWIDALKWMSNSSNMPPHSVVVAWWDYGYWITVMGNQTTVIDNATLNETQIGLVARMFLSPPDQAIRILQELHGKYVVVFAAGADAAAITRDYYLYGYELSGELYGIGGDESKVPAMIVWAGWTSNQSLFINPQTHLLTWYFWNNTLLGRLEPLQYQGWGVIDPSTGRVITIIPHYEVNYSNMGYYLIPLWTYRIYYGTNSTPFRLVYASPYQVLSNGMWAQVLIYEYVGNSTTATG